MHALDNLKQGQLESVPPLFSHSQVRKDKERRIRIVEILQVVQRRDRGASEEPGLAIVDDVQLVILLVSAD